MTPSTKLRVAVAGASGETGRSIMNGLLVGSAHFDVIALVRPGGADKAVYRDMVRAGVTLETADYYNMEALAAVLAGVDVVISCLLPLQRIESETLIDAAHRASVGRFIPSFFSPIIPPRGVMEVRDLREDLLDRCKRLYLPYTAIDVGVWYQVSLPSPYAPLPPLSAKWLVRSATTESMLVETWWQMLRFAHARYISGQLRKRHSQAQSWFSIGASAFRDRTLTQLCCDYHSILQLSRGRIA
jgi:hypothetical protein